MPKGFLMDQISRPFQIALVAVGLLAAVWLLAIHGRSASTPESSGSATSTTPAVTSGAAQEKAAAAATPTYKGAAPGVAGLTGAIAKAHGAVATSQQNAKELAGKSAQASSTATAAPSTTAAVPATKAAAPATTTHVSTTHVSTKHSSTTVVKVTKGAPAGQRAVESDLAKGNVVVLLFWTPAGSADQAVHDELRALNAIHNKLRSQQNNPTVKRLESVTGLQFAGKIAVHEASAAQVTYFGSITRGVQVNGTPTLLVINKHGRTITLAGLQDAYAIEQAIDEARTS